MIPNSKTQQGSSLRLCQHFQANVKELPLRGWIEWKTTDVPAPEYPVSARSKHVSGTVKVQVTVDNQGSVIEAKVAR